jgi:hypothetical protein
VSASVRRSQWRLARSIVALASVAALQVAGSLHYVLIEHVRCAAHGELTHGEPDHAGDAHHAAAATSHDHETAHAIAAERAAHGHDHCPVATERREDVAVSACDQWVEPAAFIVERLLDATTRASRDAPLLYAPKTSPPV